MSSAAIEPFCHGVEGQIFIHLCRRGLHPTYELELFQSRVQRAQHQLQRWEKEPNSQTLWAEGPARSCCAGGAGAERCWSPGQLPGTRLSERCGSSACSPLLAAGYQATPQLPSHPPRPLHGGDASLTAAATGRERIWFWKKVATNEGDLYIP